MLATGIMMLYFPDRWGLEMLADSVLGHLTSHDLRQCRLVSRRWEDLVSRVTQHREGGRLGWRGK